MYGHHGKILRVDLSTERATVEAYDPPFARKYLGGNGFAARLIMDEVAPQVQALDPENLIVFSVGPLTDTLVWGSSRGHVAAISPLTGLFCDSNFGGTFPAVQKRTGFEAVAISGRASGPVCLLITEKGAQIQNAASLWGKSTQETIAALGERYGPGAVCACIGPAGENGVLFANIIAGGRRPGAAGRGGLGAVMGAKNLKAVVVKGGLRTQVADRGAVASILKERFPHLRQNTRPFKALGTPFLVNVINGLGMLATRNASREVFKEAEALSGERIREAYWVRNTACHGCPVACGKEVAVAGGRFGGEAVKMPEYETLFALGTMLENDDLESIIRANHTCDLLGVDTITMGLTLSFAAECMERGIVSSEELGFPIGFGDAEGLLPLIELTARREGVGEKLALGSARLSVQWGEEATKCLYTVKGLEVAGHSPRGLRNMSLSYAVATRGGSHHDGRPNYLAVQPDPGFAPQPFQVFKNNAFTAVGDSLVICRFIAERGIGTPLNETMAALLNGVTGWDVDLPELECIGERIYNMERIINVQRGVSRKNDTLPYRVFREPIPEGPAQGRHCPPEELETMLDEYYRLRGWDHDGIPTRRKLQELGLA